MTVDRYILGLDKDKQEICQVFRDMILSAHPGIKELIKYHIPFYHLNGPLCYINPREDDVVLGFMQGTKLYDVNDLLTGDQKEVRHYVIEDADDIDDGSLRELLSEAVEYNLAH